MMYELMAFAGAMMIVVGAVMTCATFVEGEDDNDPSMAGKISIVMSRASSIGRTVAAKTGLLFVWNGLYSGMMWFLYKPHPIIQIAYVILVAGAYGMFVIHGFPLIPNPYMAGYHKIISLGVFALCIVTFCMASFTNPGVITEKTVSRYISLFPYDQMLYAPTKDCGTCKFNKVARSKHCRTCDRCVSKFDHHCIWLNNCVGERNYRWFLLYLICNSIIMVYGTVASVSIILTELYGPRKLLQANFTNRQTGEVHGPTLNILFSYFMSSHMEVMMVLLLCSVMGTIIVGFTFYHLWLAATSVTTNETFKWTDVRNWHSERLEKPWKAVQEAKKSAESKGEDPEPLMLAAYRATMGRDPKQRITDLAEPEPIPDNFYHRGWRHNFFEILFPPSLYGRPLGAMNGPQPAVNGTYSSWFNYGTVQRSKSSSMAEKAREAAAAAAQSIGSKDKAT